MCEPCAPEDPGTWQHRRAAFESGKNRRLVREGVQRSTVQHAASRSYKTGKSARPGYVTAQLDRFRVLASHRLRQSERSEDSKMQRGR